MISAVMKWCGGEVMNLQVAYSTREDMTDGVGTIDNIAHRKR